MSEGRYSLFKTVKALEKIIRCCGHIEDSIIIDIKSIAQQGLTIIPNKKPGRKKS